MEASVVGSIFFIVAFVLLFLGVFQYKKSNNQLNGVSWLMISFVAILCYGAMTAGLINMIHIPINIFTVGVIYFVTGVLLHLQIRAEKARQQYRWELYDFVYCAVLAIIVFILMGKYFTTDIQLTYFNSDAAVHFKNAMSVVRTEMMANVYFAPLHTALIIETFMPLVAEANFYKIFILTDSAMFLLELLFFMVVVRDFISSKAVKIISIIVAIVYMVGYPLNGFLFSFYYWGMGVMLIGFFLIMLMYYRTQEIDRRISLLGMMLCSAVLPVTYMIFGPIMYIAAFITLVLIRQREGMIFTLENVFLALKVFLLPTCMAIYYCLFSFLIPAKLTVGGVLSINGGVYEELYINFIWTLPFVIYMFIKMFREKQINEVLIGLLCFGAVALGMCVLIYNGQFAPYYFYKLYYPLWFFSFVLTVQALEDLWSKSRDLLISMLTVFVFLACMFLGSVEARIINSGSDLISIDKSSQVFDIWTFNRWLWQGRGIKFPQQYLDICNYVLEDLKDEEKDVPLLVTQENYLTCYWYEGITGEYCADFYGWFCEFEQIEENIANGAVNYIVVFKDTPMYTLHAEYFHQFEFVYENDLGFVAKVN